MSCKNATTELVVNGQITEALREHGFKAPHEPVALVKYPVVWEGRRRAFGCILKTRGEQRLRDFMDLHSYYVWDRGWQHDASEQMKPLLAPIAEWIGFSLRVLKEQKIDLDWDSIALENMACFKADGGYGFFLIDHEFSFPDSPLAVSSVRGVKRELREFFGDRLDWERHFYRAYVSGRVPEPIPEAQIKAAFSFG